MARRFPGVAVAVAAMLLAGSAAAAGNIASVDLQRLIGQAPQTAASDRLLKQQFAPQEKAVEQQRQKVQELRKQYRSLESGTNSFERASAAQALKDAQKELAKRESQYSSGLALRRRQLRANFRDVVDQDIQAYAKAHGYSLVVGDSVVYSGSATDITDEILAELKAQYRKVQSAPGKGAHKKNQP